jgi:hypothetical protein
VYTGDEFNVISWLKRDVFRYRAKIVGKINGKIGLTTDDFFFEKFEIGEKWQNSNFV